MILQKESGVMEIPKISANLKHRIISAAILAPLVLLILWTGGAFFSTLVVLMAVIMSFEWKGIVDNVPEGGKKLDEKQQKIWTATGVMYVSVFASSLLLLRNVEGGEDLVLFMLLLVWSTDIAAYFSGKLIGGAKICVKISPNKTWAGLLGGMAAAALIGGIAHFIFNVHSFTVMFIGGALMAVLAQAGDFFESWVKRKFGVKDSGNIIPGHGGVMDRMDGFVTVSTVFAFLVLINGGSFLQ
ncbi:MAG: phosphatidate cytidylyltransferase [Proteobacteria bacterium]|nr:phosphatidate cytidylyltransferase [Pseudomonadota bacterium]